MKSIIAAAMIAVMIPSIAYAGGRSPTKSENCGTPSQPPTQPPTQPPSPPATPTPPSKPTPPATPTPPSKPTPPTPPAAAPKATPNTGGQSGRCNARYQTECWNGDVLPAPKAKLPKNTVRALY